MNYQYFESEETLDKLLKDYEETFEMLDSISSQLLQGVITTSQQYKEILNQATGAYGCLEPLHSMAIAHKENTELKYYVEKKRELEGKGEKVVAASLDKESSESVASIRRIRNLLEGYTSVSEKIIITAQTQLKQIGQEKFKPVEEQ
jgi:hypothetical protein